MSERCGLYLSGYMAMGFRNKQGNRKLCHDKEHQCTRETLHDLVKMEGEWDKICIGEKGRCGVKIKRKV